MPGTLSLQEAGVEITVRRRRADRARVRSPMSRRWLYMFLFSVLFYRLVDKNLPTESPPRQSGCRVLTAETLSFTFVCRVLTAETLSFTFVCRVLTAETLSFTFVCRVLTAEILSFTFVCRVLTAEILSFTFVCRVLTAEILSFTFVCRVLTAEIPSGIFVSHCACASAYGSVRETIVPRARTAERAWNGNIFA